MHKLKTLGILLCIPRPYEAPTARETPLPNPSISLEAQRIVIAPSNLRQTSNKAGGSIAGLLANGLHLAIAHQDALQSPMQWLDAVATQEVATDLEAPRMITTSKSMSFECTQCKLNSGGVA